MCAARKKTSRRCRAGARGSDLCSNAPTRRTTEERAMKFMLMMNAPRGTGDWDVMKWPAEDLKAHVGHMQRIHDDLSREGVLVAAEGLAPPAQARIVRAGKDGAPLVTDGPFAEAKEFLAGYWIVDVEQPEDAYRIAARASLAPGRGGAPLNLAIEVREVMSAPPVEP
jgi:hypothetical protein